MFSSSQMSHGLLGDISMVAPVPRRDLIRAAKDCAAPPRLSDQSIHGTPPRPPSRGTSAKGRLNQLERTCYIGVPAGADTPDLQADQGPDSDRSGRGKPVWMGSGFMQRKGLEEIESARRPKIGDGSGDGHEERSPIMPWFFNTDSRLLERRHNQSQVQCVSRVMRDHNRSPVPAYRKPGCMSPGVAATPAPGPQTTFIKPDPRAPTPPLGKGKPGGLQLMVPPRSQSQADRHPEQEAERNNVMASEPHVYTRHYGSRTDGTETRNWPNQEYGIFPGSGHSTGALHNVTTKKAREYTSLKTLLRDKSTHCRSTVPLPDKYTKPVTSAQEVGWDLPQAEWHDNQQFPKMRCYFTAYDQNLKVGGVQDQLVLRRMGMKC